MNIYELLITRHMNKIDRNAVGVAVPRFDFALPATDVMISPDGSLVIALSRVDGRFVAQRGKACIVGRVDTPLTVEQIKTLECEETGN